MTTYHQQQYYSLLWLLVFLFPIVAESLSTLNSFQRHRPRLHNPSSVLRMTRDDDDGRAQHLLESLRSLRVKELKSELETRGISTRDAFEKEELVQRLYTAKICASNSSKKKKKKRRQYDDDGDIMSETIHNEIINDDIEDGVTTIFSQSTPDNIIVPFQYFSLEASKSVAAINSQDIYIRPSEGKYAAIKVTFQKTQSSTVSLNLLVDTACSGLVISPNAVDRVNRECPGIFQMQTMGATMTTAGGNQGAGVAKWDKSTNMIVGDFVVSPANGSMSNLAAVQDIGALPSGLDGIIGLSFLNQFATVDFDFTNGRLCLYKKDVDPPLPSHIGQLSIVAQGRLSLTRLGIYTTQTNLGGRGPVSMLVDTGATSSFLNWNGVSQLNLSQESPLVNPIAASIGAMGADNMALQLTHRFVLKRWNLSTENAYSPAGLPCLDGINIDGINIDIGDLPVLEQLKGDGVGGILGADLLMMCDLVRFSGMNARSPTMTLWKSEER